MRIKPRIFRGTRDSFPQDMFPKEWLLTEIRKIFRSYGFAPIETPAFEFVDILNGKYGGEGEKLFYRLSYKDGNTLALRYDLTVPLARFVAMHLNEIVFPFKRYQIQPVWRAERAQLRQGRFREFYQCDVDIVGSDKLTSDAEIIALTKDIMERIGLTDIIIRINHRALLRAMVRVAGYADKYELEVLRALDKLDKIGKAGVEKELMKISDDKAKAEKLFELTSMKLDSSELKGLDGVKELLELNGLLSVMGVPTDAYTFDLSLARGLDYYTGVVFEVKLRSLKHIGSLSGGGRYDKLIGVFAGRDIPAVGTTIGLDRILTALEQLDLIPKERSRLTLLFANFGVKEFTQVSLSLVRKCRLKGINADFYHGKKDIRAQLGYASELYIPYIAFIGEEEYNSSTVKIKDMQSSKQIILSQGNFVDEFLELIKSSKSIRHNRR